MRDWTHQTPALLLYALYYTAIFKYIKCALNLSIKTKQATASGVLQQIDNLYFWGVVPTTPPATVIHTFISHY